jgi:predicted transcriptional regulator
MSSLNLYRSYNFTDKDPVIDLIGTVISKSGRTYQQIAAEAGVSEGTLRNWIYGSTKRPQFATVMAVGALGYSVSWREMRNNEVVPASEQMARLRRTLMRGHAA